MTDFDRDFPGWRTKPRGPHGQALTPEQIAERDEALGWNVRPQPMRPVRGLYDEIEPRP